MAHFLNLEQLVVEARIQEIEIEHFIDKIQAAADDIALLISQKRKDVRVTISADLQEEDFGGLCVGFGPVHEGDKCPDDFKEYDSCSQWAEEG